MRGARSEVGEVGRGGRLSRGIGVSSE